MTFASTVPTYSPDSFQLLTQPSASFQGYVRHIVLATVIRSEIFLHLALLLTALTISTIKP
ncbi:hypothetical protein M378DRAFT_159889 [Amanita muscaria Koide BX008]|uniref:Uncharacterized protein n=1 Tax=Amanita muscaria (strain Koide BX008) TaxID=946122 RepID=A0A0C2WYQ2_AMAMK|nr:hypothetical protein M378DRAFT_159889 [Amanita muscaria Koide BX008]